MIYRLLPLMLVGVMEYKFMVKLTGSEEEKELARLFEKLLDDEGLALGMKTPVLDAGFVRGFARRRPFRSERVCGGSLLCHRECALPDNDDF